MKVRAKRRNNVSSDKTVYGKRPATSKKPLTTTDYHAFVLSEKDQSVEFWIEETNDPDKKCDSSLTFLKATGNFDCKLQFEWKAVESKWKLTLLDPGTSNSPAEPEGKSINVTVGEDDIKT